MGRVEDEIRNLIDGAVRSYDVSVLTYREKELLARVSQLEKDMNTLKSVFSFVFSEKSKEEDANQ